MEDTILVSFTCGVQYQDKIYLAAANMNALFVYDLKTNQLRYLTSFMREQQTQYLFRKAFLNKNEAWFIPERAQYIVSVNLESLDMQWISLDYHWVDYEETLKCASAGVYLDKYLYTVPYGIDSVMIIDMETKQAKVFYDICSDEEKYAGAYYDNNVLWFTPWKGNQVLGLNVDTGEKIRRSWSYGNAMFCEPVIDKGRNQVWYMPAQANYILANDIHGIEIKRLSFENRTYSKIPLEIDFHSYYGKIVEDRLFILPFDGENIIQIDLKTNKLMCYPIVNTKAILPFYRIIDSEHLCAVIEGTNELVIYDERNRQFQLFELKLGKHEFYNQFKQVEFETSSIRNHILCNPKNILLEDYVSDGLL